MNKALIASLEAVMAGAIAAGLTVFATSVAGGMDEKAAISVGVAAFFAKLIPTTVAKAQ